MSGRAKKAVAPKKKANGYKMPPPIPVGEVINDTIGKKKWRIGPSIGVGGFGEIYSACEDNTSPKKAASYPFVIKIEPHENGPLFVEKHFYVRNANKNDIESYMKTKKLSSLGMPTYFGNGSHIYKGEKFRYLVLERYGKDVWTLFKDSGRSFPPPTVFQLGLQMLDVLEYIHSRGYVHADLKGANILMGLKKGTENQAFLVDFGLATRVSEKEFKPDPKCAHNGTIEYTSRDAHLGVSTMRGDLEILGYNMLQWLVGELPWEKSLKLPKTVQDMKENFMNNVRSNITKQYSNVPEALIKFFEYINSMKPKDEPDYSKCRKLFEGYLKTEGKAKAGKLEFTADTKKKTKRLQNDDENEVDKKNDKNQTKKRSPKENSDARKVVKRGRKPKTLENSETNDEEEDSIKDNGDVPKVVKRGIKQKTQENSDTNDEEEDSIKENGDVPKVVKRVRKSKTQENSETNDEEEDSIKENKSANKKGKRKSLEPSLVVQVKKTRMTPRATPPAKQNHANIATQTSVEKLRRSPRQVSFESPVCEIMGENKILAKTSDTSGDIFEDSFKVKKPKTKKRLISDEEVTVKRVVKRKVTTVKAKGKSWKDAPAVMNGRSPPK